VKGSALVGIEGRGPIRGQPLLLVSTVALVLASGASPNGEPRHSFKAADQALARSIVLTPADIGHGFAEGTTSRAPEADGPRCRGAPDESDLTVTGTSTRQIGPRRGDLPLFWSGASVFLSADESESAFRREMRPTLVTCLIHRMIANFASGSGGTPPMQLALISRSLKRMYGPSGEAAVIRLVFEVLRMGGVPLGNAGFYNAEDLVVCRKGRTEAWFYGFFQPGTLVHPPRPKHRFAVERTLLARLLARMP
jgi:hypothetical protein